MRVLFLPLSEGGGSDHTESLHEKALVDCGTVRVQLFFKILWIHSV